MDIISITGCGLSLFGLLCIWVIALCCKKWRSQSSNKLLLHICLVLTLIMAYFLFLNIPQLRSELINIANRRHCIAEGAFLQYSVLVLFLWMLLLAIMQYKRYVIVLGIQRPRHFILKYALLAWGLPLVPTAVVVYFDATSYMPYNKNGEEIYAICYPSGLSLYLAVLLPISLIVTTNLGIFIYIMCSIRHSLGDFKRENDKKNLLVQVRLSILLFSVLGIAWIFGILAHIDESRILSVIFCLTATLQGFVLFVYIVVIDQSVHYTWMKCCCGNDYYTLEETNLQPMSIITSTPS